MVWPYKPGRQGEHRTAVAQTPDELSDAKGNVFYFMSCVRWLMDLQTGIIVQCGMTVPVGITGPFDPDCGRLRLGFR